MSEAGAGIEGLRPDSAFVRYVAGRLGTEDFKLLDVGCAGGLPSGWRAFGDRLAARGYDCNLAEISRLNAEETNPKVAYEAGFVGMPDGHPLKVRIGSKAYWHMWVDKRLAYERTYQIRSAKAAGEDALDVQDYFDKVVLAQDWSPLPANGFDLDYARDQRVFEISEDEVAAERAGGAADRTIYLPANALAHGFGDVDFLKLDIDGPDFEVLRSAAALLSAPGVLGAALEVCFYGSHDANDNTFHNTDRLMRSMGFDLFALSTRTYASAAMPWPYLDAHPSMNTGGRPVQGDAIYIRDLASRGRRAEADALSDDKIAKQACLLALFGLPDYAAETLIAHRARLSRLFDIDYALDLLAQQIQEPAEHAKSFRDYVAAFEAEAPEVFDQYTRRSEWLQGVLKAANNEPVLAQTVAALEEDAERQAELAAQKVAAAAAEADRLRVALAERDAELAERDARLADAHRQLHQFQHSRLWRAIAPVRRLAGALRGRRT